jgi:hypothetical protein
MNSLIKKSTSLLLRIISFIIRGCIEVLTSIASIIDFVRIAYLDYIPRPDDIFIVSYPRSGTTWMQMILYQLSSDGNMNFTHISEVCPWFERMLSFNIMNGKDLEKLPSPRIFKSHLSYKWIPHGSCKYIYVIRDGKDVAVSYFHFYTSHLNFTGNFSEFFDKYFMRGNVQYGSWFKHVAQWKKHEKDSDVLFIHYEDLVNDLESTLSRIIAFCGFDVAEDRMPEIIERCSFAFMKKYENKFDHISAVIWEKGYKQNSFIRKGQSGSGNNYFNNEQETLFNEELTRMELTDI